MASQSISERISASTVMFVVGVIADATAAIFFLVSSETRSWLRHHYLTLTIAGLLMVAVILALLNHLQSQREKITELQVTNDDLASRLALPTEHDLDMFKAINEYASPQSTLLIWLRDGFLVTRFQDYEIRALEKLAHFFEREPRGFDDAQLEEKYRTFLEASRVLLNKINENVWVNPPGDWYSVPSEWEVTQPERLEEAINAISSAHDAIIESYDAFFLAAQQKRLKSFIAIRRDDSS